jgi:hypothetical protein
MMLIKIDNWIVNLLVKASDFSVSSVLIVPTEYFLYYSTRGSMILNQRLGKNETRIMEV